MDKRTLGQLGEQHARTYLESLGYQIVTSNFYTKAGEIDIIARDHESLVFVEVKLRTSKKFGYPETQMHWRKIRHFQNAAQIYLLKNNIHQPFRLDVVSINMTQGAPEFLHYKNISL